MPAGIFGPHFAHLCREWTRRFADDQVLGGTPSRIAPAVMSDAKERQKRQLDVVALASGHGEQPRVLAIGEAKFTSAPHTMGDVVRLEQIRDLVRATKSNHFAVDHVKLVLFSAAGFDADTLRQRDLRSDLVLVDLERLYTD